MKFSKDFRNRVRLVIVVVIDVFYSFLTKVPSSAQNKSNSCLLFQPRSRTRFPFQLFPTYHIHLRFSNFIIDSAIKCGCTASGILEQNVTLVITIRLCEIKPCSPSRCYCHKRSQPRSSRVTVPVDTLRVQLFFVQYVHDFYPDWLSLSSSPACENRPATNNEKAKIVFLFSWHINFNVCISLFTLRTK